jgi:hypothetical protein
MCTLCSNIIYVAKRYTNKHKGENKMDFNFSVSIDVIRGNSVVNNSAVVDADTFDGDWRMLMTGAETPCEWDDDGNVTAYAVLSEDRWARDEADELFTELGL